MTGQRPDDETFLRSHITDLPRSIEPARDLWPPIEARLTPRVRTRPRRLPYQVAAAIMLVTLSSAITWFLVRKTASPVVVVATAPVDRAEFARLARAGDVLEEGLGSSSLAPGTRAVLARNLVVIDSAIAECQRALDADPGSPVLAGLLRAAHRQRVEFLQQAARLPRS
jgi:hypothetical protein